MATVIAVTDHGEWGSNTDNIVVADPRHGELLWVPRDMWVEEIHQRINKAFALGGHQALLQGLAVLGIEVEHSLCLRREATERVLEGVTVTVPVEEPLRLWYPLEPTTRMQDGRKPVDFDPPAAVLTGERLHQWVGARYSRTGPSSDLKRIRRQQVLVRALLRQGFDFACALDDPELVRMSSPAALEELRRVRASWRFGCLEDVVPRTIDGMSVLVRRGEPAP